MTTKIMKTNYKSKNIGKGKEGKSNAIVGNAIVDSKNIADYVDRYVGNRAKIRRLLLGLSQDELAKEMGIDAEQVKKYERGVSKIYGAVLYRLGQCLKVPVSYFFDKVEDEMERDLSVDNPHMAVKDMTVNVKENELLPLVKAYKSIAHIQDRRKISDLMMLFAG